MITSKQLVEAFERFLSEKWGYVYGAQGEPYTQELARKWKAAGRNAPNSSWDRETYFTESCAKWFGHRVADCSGGIVYAIQQHDAKFYDRSANTFKEQFTESGTVDIIPEIPGIALWRSGHIGVYVGNGYAIEFRGTNYGCVKTKVAERNWTHWGKIKGVDYNAETQSTGGIEMQLDTLREGSKGPQVMTLQKLLEWDEYPVGDIDGAFGPKTTRAVKQYQIDNKLTADGIVGAKTWAKILKGE